MGQRLKDVRPNAPNTWFDIVLSLVVIRHDNCHSTRGPCINPAGPESVFMDGSVASLQKGLITFSIS